MNALTLQSQNETVVKLGCQAIHGVSNEIRLDNIWEEKRTENGIREEKRRWDKRREEKMREEKRREEKRREEKR